MDVLPVEASDPELGLWLLHPQGVSRLPLPIQHLPSFLQGFYIQGNVKLEQTLVQE